MSLIERLVEQFSDELQRSASGAVRVMARRWIEIEAGLQEAIERLAQEIEQEGGDIRRSRLLSMERYRALLVEVELEIGRYVDSVAVGAIEGLTDEGRGVAVENSRHLIGAVANEEVRNAFGGLVVAPTERIVAIAQLGQPLNALLSRAYPATAEAITQVLIQGVALGWNPRKTAREVVKNGLSQGLNHILLVARDQQMRHYRAASRERYRASGFVTRYRRIATKDERTCVACLALDGTEYPIDVAMPTHPQDRCETIPIVAGFAVPTWETGAAWFGRQSADKQREILGAQRFALWQNGISLREMVATKQNVIWGASVGVVPVKELR